MAGSINQFTHQRVQAVACVGDVDEGFRRQVFDDIQAKFGKVQILFPRPASRDSLAAKIDKTSGKVALYPVEDFRSVVEVNLIADLLGQGRCSLAASGPSGPRPESWKVEEHVRGHRRFHWVGLSRGNKGQIAYATKAGQRAARTLMMEAMFHAVRCGVIHPGF